MFSKHLCLGRLETPNMYHNGLFSCAGRIPELKLLYKSHKIIDGTDTSMVLFGLSFYEKPESVGLVNLCLVVA